MTVPTLQVLKTMTRSELLAIRVEVERRLRILRNRDRKELHKAMRRIERERRRAAERAALDKAAGIAGVSGPKASKLVRSARPGRGARLRGDIEANIRAHETARLRSDAKRAATLAEQAGPCLTELLEPGSGRS
ncbi:hypothetical protein [Palleronia sp.]|uniref:hypothetical protein n=1 Tax=Palleronia sp. TaxID=1940284 RepID=UPI0035C8731F